MLRTFILSITFLASTLFSLNADSAVRYNPLTRLWEGNVCMTQWGWSWYAWQPIGSYCTIRMPNGQFVTGFISNQ